MKRSRWIWPIGLTLALILAACGGQMGLQGAGVTGSSGSGPLTGAIYTTKGDGWSCQELCVRVCVRGAYRS